MVIAITEHVCDLVLKRVLKPLAYRLQIFLEKYEYLRSSQLCDTHGVSAKPKKRVSNHVLATLTTNMETRLKSKIVANV